VARQRSKGGNIWVGREKGGKVLLENNKWVWVGRILRKRPVARVPLRGREKPIIRAGGGEQRP